MYAPPPLNFRIRLRNPADEPTVLTGRYGRPVNGTAQWGVDVWAGREDRQPDTEFEEEQTVREIAVIWTVRHRPGVAANAEIVHDGGIYESIGPPVLRGGPGSGRAARYWEIHSRLRT